MKRKEKKETSKIFFSSPNQTSQGYPLCFLFSTRNSIMNAAGEQTGGVCVSHKTMCSDAYIYGTKNLVWLSLAFPEIPLPPVGFFALFACAVCFLTLGTFFSDAHTQLVHLAHVLCVDTCTNIHTYIYIYMYIYTHMCACIHTRVDACLNVFCICHIVFRRCVDADMFSNGLLPHYLPFFFSLSLILYSSFLFG